MPTFQSGTLYRPKNGTWLFTWYNLNPATLRLERIRNTFDINRIRDLRERYSIAVIKLGLLNEALRNGYNHFTAATTATNSPAQPEIAVMPAIQPEIAIPAALTVVHATNDSVQQKTAIHATDLAIQSEMSITAALTAALKIRKLGTKTRTAHSYDSHVNRLTQWLQLNKHDHIAVSDFTADMFQEYLFYKAEQGHGNANLNEHTCFFKTTFKLMQKKMRLIKENPIENFDYLPECESTLFQPLTDDEIARIVPVLYAHNPRFYLYTRFIAHEYIRPWHIARLKASDIGYEKEMITVGGSSTKNRKNRNKQLLQPIKDMLIEMDYHKLPGNYYLFGKDFEPSPTLYSTLSIRAAELWKKLVIDGLGINKKMYALKHTSSQYYVNENDNADLKYLQQQMEHHSMAQTEIYLQGKVYKKMGKDVKTLKY